MREAAFIKQNREKWKHFEGLLNGNGKQNPDKLSDLFIQVTDDLAYARTYYKKSKTTTFLNALAGRVHQSIYINKKEEKNRLVGFWKYEVPQIVANNHKQLIYSVLFFFAFCLIGAVSAAHDENFVRVILGDAYVNMTIENIKKNDPMAVYKHMGQIEMFFYITTNNIVVAIRTLGMGIFFSLGTVFALFMNGVMLGSFQYFFYEYNVLGESLLTIWIHGTLEISAIVIAGGAGLILGNSLLFPGTHSRMTSLKMRGKDAVKILVSIIPVLIVAGFLESFVTRLTHWPTAFRLGVIILSAIFIIGYFVILPMRVGRKE
jgi:uncharacterized membrane protein SpoIIM required for sporulation